MSTAHVAAQTTTSFFASMISQLFKLIGKALKFVVITVALIVAALITLIVIAL